MYKNRIGITQKLIKHPEYDETLTCLDNNWFNLITKINALPIPIPMTIGIDSRDIIKSLNLDGLIFSGGNSLAELEDGSNESKELSEKNNNKITVENIFFRTKHYQGSNEFTIRFIYFNYELF